MGTFERCLGSHDIRDRVVDYMTYWPERTELPQGQLLKWQSLRPVSSTLG